MSPKSFRLLVDRVLDKNPDLHEGESVDELFTTLDSDHSVFGFNFYSDPVSQRVYIEGDLPVPQDQTKKVVKQVEDAGYTVTAIHEKDIFDGNDIHATTVTTPAGAPDAISKAMQFFEEAMNNANKVSRHPIT